MDKWLKFVEELVIIGLFAGVMVVCCQAHAVNGVNLRGISYPRYIIQHTSVHALKDTTTPGSKVYHAVDQMPKLKGSLKRLYQQVPYPPKCRQAGIQGIVYVQFVVNKKGMPAHIHVLKGIGRACDQAAVVAVKKHARFTPGLMNGKRVRVQMSLPVPFKMQANSSRIYSSADKMPHLKMSFIDLESKVDYPKKCRDSGISGKVILQFVVNKKGFPKNVHVIKGIGEVCDSSAVAAVKKYATFKPGKIKGKPVNVQATLPIVFNDYYFPKVYKEVPVVPRLKMHMAEFQNKVRYSRSCLEAGIEGTVIVQFVINKKGMPTHVHIVKGIGGSCDKAALEAVKKYARFTPGKKGGKPVKVQMLFPIRFRLR